MKTLARSSKAFASAMVVVVLTAGLAGCLSEQVADSSAQLTLPSNHPPVDGAAPVLSSKLAVTSVSYQLGGREFVLANLRNVFLSSTTVASDVAAFEAILNATIQTVPGVFGGGLNLYSTLGLKATTDGGRSGNEGAMTNDDNDMIRPHVDSTPARTAMLGETCRRILGNDVYFLEAIRKIGVTAPASTPVTADRITALLSIFRPGFQPPPGLVSSYLTAVQAASSTGTPLTTTETWRMVVDVTCEDPYWQAL